MIPSNTASTAFSAASRLAVLSGRLLLGIMLIASVLPARAQRGASRAPVIDPSRGIIPVGGRYKPSLTGKSVFRVLVVFVRFRGDTVRTASWPDPEKLPAWASTMLDKDVASIGKHPRNLSAYYRENSRGRFRIVGDVFYLTTDSTEEYYHERFLGRETDRRGVIVRDALRALDNPRGPYKVDFRRYDNWTHVAPHAHRPGRDGQVDLICFLTRSYRQNPYGSPDPRAGRYKDFARTAADFNLPDGSMAFDGVRVNHSDGFVDGKGSGIMLFASNTDKLIHVYDSLAVRGGPRLYGEVIHELSHYFFGAGHVGNSDVSLSATRYTSFLSGYSIHNGNAFGNFLGYEKARMGWLDEKKNGGLRTVALRDTDVTVTLADPSDLKPGAVHLVKLPFDNTDQYLLFESRGWRGHFEPRVAAYNGAQARLLPGVLVTHLVKEAESFPDTRIRVVCADGLFRWKIASPPRAGEDPATMTVIARDSADPVHGYDEREKIFIDGRPGRSWLAGYWPGSPGKPARGPYPDCTNCLGAANDAADNVGDRYDLFQPGDVLTPWSNPALSIWNGRAFARPDGAPVGVHFLPGKAGAGSYALRIIRGDLSALPPSKPTGLKAERLEGGCPLLRWSPNREPSVTGAAPPGSYVIERSFDGSAWTPVAELRHPVCAYRESCADWPRDARHALYRVRVTDGRGRVSNWSEPLRVPMP